MEDMCHACAHEKSARPAVVGSSLCPMALHARGCMNKKRRDLTEHGVERKVSVEGLYGASASILILDSLCK